MFGDYDSGAPRASVRECWVRWGLGGRGAFDGAGDAVQHEPAELHFVARMAREHVAGTCLLYQNATPMVIGQYAPTLYEPTEP